MKTIRHILLSSLLALAAVFSVPASGGALTDFAENKVIDALLRGQTLGAPATGLIRLYTVCPTDSTAGTEVTGGSYAPASLTASLANWSGTQSAGSTTASSGTSGTSSNNVSIPFITPTASWGTVVCWGYGDATNLWFYSPLTISKTVNSGDSVSFSPAAASLQIDN